jgi:hypothetical protein
MIFAPWMLLDEGSNSRNHVRHFNCDLQTYNTVMPKIYAQDRRLTMTMAQPLAVYVGTVSTREGSGPCCTGRSRIAGLLRY